MKHNGLVQVFHAELITPLPKDLKQRYLAQLPQKIQQKNARFRFWQDQHRHLFGVLLLQKALQKHGYEKDLVHSMVYNAYGRPSLPICLDFNISHSGDHVFCAVSKDLEVGIDTEELVPICFRDFSSVMSESQLATIESHANPLWCFYHFWTIKESIIKAEGLGISEDIKDIQILEGHAVFQNRKWNLSFLDFGETTCVSLATNGKAHVQLETINLM